MQFLNANQIEPGSILNTDICIIGSGAAGITLAHEFNKSNLSVTILEAGGTEFESELQTDYQYEARNWFQGEWPYTRTRQWGGSTSVWYGRCTQLQPHDFVERDWVQNSGWPITYDDVEKYIKRALNVLQVQDPAAIKPAFWKDSPTANAFQSEKIDPKVFLWSDPKDMADAHEKWVEASPNIRLCYYAFVQEIIPTASDDHISSVSVRSAHGATFSVAAETVILACGGIENSRLLLLSQRNNANGVGNQHDNVGRYLMDHPRIDALAKLHVNFENPNWKTDVGHLTETITEHGRVQVFLTMTEEIQQEQQLLNHCTVFRPIFKEEISPSYLAAKRFFYEAKGKLSEESRRVDLLRLITGFPQLIMTSLKKALKRPLTFSHLVLIDQLEQEPDRESRVMLGEKLDRFNQPQAILDWRIGASTTDSLRIFHQHIDTHLRENNLGWLDSPLLTDPDLVPNYTDACHPTGTTRMSHDPQLGVVDTDCRVFGFDNLYVIGSSVFPTVGYANSTLTLVALAIRLADTIKAQSTSTTLL